MTGLKADEKICPYCAETIKAAAIKCRYCGSDLSEQPAEPAAADEVVEPVETPVSKTKTPPETLPGVEEEPPTDEPRERRGLWEVLASAPATAALVVLIAVLLGAAYAINARGSDDGIANDGQVVDAQTRSVALTQASELVQDALSYDYKDFDKVRDKNRTKMTSGFRKQYDTAMKAAEGKTKKYQVTLKTTVVASGIQSITGHEAKVLLFINQVTSAESGPNKTPTTQLNRTVVTLTRADGAGGDWQIDGIDPLAGQA